MRHLSICLAALLTGGVAMAGPAYHMTTPFRPADFQAWAGSGHASLFGVVNYNDEEGIARHCVRARIELIPATPYNAEMVAALKEASYRPVVGENPAAVKYVKTVSCEGNGSFSFTNLPAKNWFVRTTLTWNQSWEYGVRTYHSDLIRRVSLKPGKNQVVLSDQDRLVEYSPLY